MKSRKAHVKCKNSSKSKTIREDQNSSHLNRLLFFFFNGVKATIQKYLRAYFKHKCDQFSCTVMSNSLQPHGLQAHEASLSVTNSRSLLRLLSIESWCHPTISSSVDPFSSCLQSFPTSESFQTSQLFASGGQSIGVSASTSVLPMNTKDWFLLGWTGWISLQSKGLSRVLQHHSSKASILWHLAFFVVQLSHPYMTTGKGVFGCSMVNFE